MTTSVAVTVPGSDARLHAMLRFATAVTGAFVVCELMRWGPSCLAPILAAAVLNGLPTRPSLKVAVVLVATMTVAALFAYVIASQLRGMPTVLFGLIAVCMFACLFGLLRGKPGLPILLMLICLSTFPVIVMVAPAQADILPLVFIRSMVLAMVAIELVFMAWPQVPAAAAPTKPPPCPQPLTIALLATAVLVPQMLVFMLFGLTDALVVIITTVLLVVTFDPRHGRAKAMARVTANFGGGLLGLILHALLLTTPNLAVLGVLLFVATMGFARRLVAGEDSAVALVACNAMLVILSLSIATGPGSFSLWVTRMTQLLLAGAFTVGMMYLIWHRPSVAHAPTAAPSDPETTP